MTALTLEPESGESVIFGTTVSDLQTDIAVADGAITGTLKYYDDPDAALVRDWGAGNFLVLKFLATDWDEFDSVKVGLDPSEGSGLVEIISDPDKNGVFKITDKDEQAFKIVSYDGIETKTQTFDLSGLTVLDS